MQQFTSYAVSDDVQQASAIPSSEKVSSDAGHEFTTTPDLAQNVRQAGSAVASGVQTVGEYVGKGIVQVGEWYRSRYAPCEEDVKVSDRTKSRCVMPTRCCQLRWALFFNSSTELFNEMDLGSAMCCACDSFTME